MKAAIYLRVSTEDQTTANQLPELTAFAERRGTQIVASYADEAISGSKEMRPGLDALCQDAKAGKFTAVLCWKFDRISRNTRHLLTLHEELNKLGVALVSVTEAIDTSTPAGKFTMTVMGGVAELERANLIERTKAGLARVRASGVKLGCPVGKYRNTALESSILTLKAEGKGVRQIARTLGVAASTVSFKLAQIKAA